MLDLIGQFEIQLIRKDELVFSRTINNGIATAGKDYLLNACFGLVTPASTWYIGLINNAGFSTLAPSDTMSSHAGWSELIDYNEGSRQLWTPVFALAGTITGISTVSFDINATVDVRGMFLASDSSKNGTAGRLWSTASFPAESLTATDEFRVNYTLNA